MDSNTELVRRIEYILDPKASAMERVHRRSHLTNHDLRTILTALPQPAEQIADGAVGEKYTDGGLTPQKKPLADAFNGIEVVKNHVHAQQARAQALEEAAKVAEGGFKHRITRIRIATAIRALNGQGGGV